MGYKLAGYEMLGGVDIDPEMMGLYRANHLPRHSYLMGVQDFNKIPDADLPRELFELDILDGSPPCSSFSVAGSREDAWGKEKKFREGQSTQILDDLFFHFIATARKLSPKVVIAENVKGLVLGNAKGYVKEIFQHFDAAGYKAQLFLLNSARMGVPQVRERTFFVAHRKELPFARLTFNFVEPPVSVKMAWDGLPPQMERLLSDFTKQLWIQAKPGESVAKYNGGKGFTNVKLPYENPSMTLTSQGGLYHPFEPRNVSPYELIRIQTFPDDYNFLQGKRVKFVQYVCGMSVPPFMMQRVAHEIHRQWFGGTP